MATLVNDSGAGNDGSVLDVDLWRRAVGHRVDDFDAIGNGIADDLPAFDAAVAALPSDGGIIDLTRGKNYRLSANWDITSKQNVWVRGQGAWCTRVTSDVTATAAITASNASTVFTRLSNFALYQSGMVLPTVARAGNYGIRNDTAVAYALEIDHCDIRFFGASGILIEGATGPVYLRDNSIQSISDYGISVLTLAGIPPQDVTIERGNIQACWGGIHNNYSNGCHISDPDIELADAHFPCIYFEGSCYGGQIDDPTCSIGDVTPTPAGVIVLGDNPSGIAGTAGIIASANNATDLLLLTGSGTINNRWDGGTWQGKGSGSSGYAVRMAGATGFAMINPQIVAFTFETNKDVILAVAANFVTAIGCRTSTHAAKTLQAILPDGTLVDGKFSCNAATPQAAAASGGALATYAAGANGLDTGAHMASLHALVVAMRAALVANGIMS